MRTAQLRTISRVSLLATLGALLLSGAGALVTSTSAAAHDEIVASYPEAGSTVGVAPDAITLTFSDEIITESSAVVIEVIAPHGENVAAGSPLVDGTTVSQTLAPDQGPGMFTVRWRVVSSDGHPISDEYTYTVETLTIITNTPTPVDTAAMQTPSATAADTDGTGHGEPSGGGALLPGLALLSGVVVVGGALIVVMTLGRQRRRRDRAAATSPPSTETEVLADES
ncbi:copper resistance CopC family protein [Microbacterium sp. 2FI]|uniref:copper resistance CopC family protein n=1 Tax=Microbacterium sp. 2FI TaxID=2502193 RepID=UPI001485BA17|nr:copper resistance CopC family protein [Microbacterium sp. 2FI]